MSETPRLSMPVPQPSASETTAVLLMIERAARDPGIDLDKLQRLLDLRQQMEARAAEQKFNAALAAASAEIVPVVADARNDQTRSKYATYAALDRAIRPIYSRHGISVSFDTDVSPKGPDHMRVLAYVAGHGHVRVYKVDLPIVTKGPQGRDVMTPIHAAGSANTYGKRYLLINIFAIAVADKHDDDGNRAGGLISDGPAINQEQLQQLQAALEITASNIDGFCSWFGIETIAELPAARFADAIALLRKKAERMGSNNAAA
jgi:hypothetical protein